MAVHQHLHATENHQKVGVVVLAAGSGERLGIGPKALVEVGGKPLLLHVLESMASNSSVVCLAVTAPADLIAAYQKLVDSAGLAIPTRVTPGGATRQQSGHLGVRALPLEADWVAITDVARPFTPPGIIDVLLENFRIVALDVPVGQYLCGIVPALPLVDSVHLLGAEPLLAEPFDRSLLRAAQTPQLFDRGCVTAAYEAAAKEGTVCTDDVGMVTHFGGTVATAPGNPSNFKITYEHDLALAEALHAYAPKGLAGSEVSI
ncbi:IspD/TarI family cytidylyltransferase [Streptomyces prunicolor]|uniref:IspD/TarI family cytidylyltransferase n=1 Tax=Streptomyces prunicolor TaxID=67348 RepID=UPI0007C5586F|nr:IspD/TarI family cytidylyltransferase [Streptomyces prunicolor]